MHKIGQPGGALCRPLGAILKTGLSLLKNELKPLAKSVLISLRLTIAAAAVTDAAIQKKTFFDQVWQIYNFKRGNKWYHENI